MGLFDAFRKGARKVAEPSAPEAIAAEAAAGAVCAPVAGRVVAMKEIPDPVFASEALGPGCGVWPEGELAYAPVSGTVSVTMGHAVGLAGDDGVEVLVHVGLDTVDMEGRGFTPYVREGEHVTAGQPVLGFSKSAIAAAGHESVVVVAVTNAGSFSAVRAVVESGAQVAAGARLIEVVRA